MEEEFHTWVMTVSSQTLEGLTDVKVGSSRMEACNSVASAAAVQADHFWCALPATSLLIICLIFMSFKN